MKTMLLQKYNPKWMQDFQQIKDIVKNALNGLSIRTEHIGSTAIQDLAAKPIIDIDIVYSHPKEFNIIKRRLLHIGYCHVGNQGIPQREVFKRSIDADKNPVLDNIRHHLYVCPADSDEFKRHILFRDFLIENDWAKKEYWLLKLKIAEETDQDHKAYAKLKEEKAKQFIEHIINLAKIKNSANALE
jgi:GrpB-like predicted nucleotidyltransferase (UPF0157 family)